MAQKQGVIRFFCESPCYSLRHRRLLKTLLLKLFKKERIRLGSLSYILTTDARVRALNKQFLRHDYFTDILTFDLSESGYVVGEVYISVERVRENALDYETTFKNELLRVIFHGALHLCGFDDRTVAGRKAMREQEDIYVRQFIKLVASVPRETTT